MTIDSPAGLDLAALDGYLHNSGIQRSGPLHAELIAGGRSNLTYAVRDDVSAWVLRRPPMHGLTPSAHDMTREYTVVAALAGTSVPVAQAVALCEDESVLGAPFGMVEFVAGRVVRSSSELDALGGRDEVERCVDSLVQVLADLHAVDPASVGLGEFGRPDGYLERQVRRWGGQWQYVRLDDDSRDADLARLHSALEQAMPAQSATSIVHGDYRIDNTIIDADDPAVVRAVLDWEMSTLGDPISDAALMCVYRNPAMDLIIDMKAAWTSPMIPSADGLAERYSSLSGRELAHWPFYMALAYFKLAIIAAGIDFRGRLAGADESTDDSDRVAETVAPLIAEGLSALTH